MGVSQVAAGFERRPTRRAPTNIGPRGNLNREEHHAYSDAYRPGGFGCRVRNFRRRRQRPGQILKIGTEGAYPPFNNLTADGKLEGFDIDIANALCDEMKVKCEFVTQDWDGIIPALQAGKFDAIIASMSITEERKQKVDFTDKYYNTPPAIAAPKDTDIKGVTKEDLAGKTIGVATSTTHFNYAEKTYTDSTLKGYPSSQEVPARPRQRPPRRGQRRHQRARGLAGDAGRRLLQDGRRRSQPVPEIHGAWRRHRGAQGRDRPGQQVQRGDRRDPRQRQVQGNQRQVLQVRRLRRRIPKIEAQRGRRSSAAARAIGKSHQREQTSRCRASGRF